MCFSVSFPGVRTFCPRPVAKMVLNVGGVSALLGLIAMAADVEGLYAAVKALVCVVRSNKNAQREMTRTDGYKARFKSGNMNHIRMSAHENATPIRILHNPLGQLVYKIFFGIRKVPELVFVEGM